MYPAAGPPWKPHLLLLPPGLNRMGLAAGRHLLVYRLGFLSVFAVFPYIKCELSVLSTPIFSKCQEQYLHIESLREYEWVPVSGEQKCETLFQWPASISALVHPRDRRLFCHLLHKEVPMIVLRDSKREQAAFWKTS